MVRLGKGKPCPGANGEKCDTHLKCGIPIGKQGSTKTCELPASIISGGEEGGMSGGAIAAIVILLLLFFGWTFMKNKRSYFGGFDGYGALNY